MKAVYLAGPISGESYGVATDWREYAEDCLSAAGLGVRSPMRGKGGLAGSESLPMSDLSDTLCRPHTIVTRDFSDIRASDLLLVNLRGAKRVTVGTMVEIGYAAAFGKPIIVVMEAESLHDHPFVRETASAVVETLDEGLLVACSFLDGDEDALRVEMSYLTARLYASLRTVH